MLALLEAENAFVAESLAHTDDLQAALFEEMKARIKETDLSVPFRKGGRWFYSRTEEGQQYPILCRTAVEPPADLPDDEPMPGEEVLLDLNVLAGDSDYFALGAYDLAPWQDLLLYSTDHDGSERYTMRIRDLRTGDDLPDVIPDTTYGIGLGGRRHRLLRAPRRRHAPAPGVAPRPSARRPGRRRAGLRGPRRALLRVGRPQPHRGSGSTSPPARRSPARSSSIPAADPTAAPRLVQPREQGVEYDVTHAPQPRRRRPLRDPHQRRRRGELQARHGAGRRPGSRALAGARAPPPRREARGRDAPSPATSCATSAGRACAGSSSCPTPAARAELAMPEEVYDTGPATNAEFETDDAPLHLHVARHPEHRLRRGPRHRRAAPAQDHRGARRPRPDDYETGRLWATAPDGTRVPISYVHRAGVAHDGSAPCLLYGYGSYEACIDPGFSTLRLSLLDRGFVFAIAHVRGGGEMGRPWYDDGKLLHKRNTFTDFIACAEHLVAEGLTAPDRLVARGASAGGLLMGAVTNLRPDLFAAVVAEVPFVDCLTTILDETLPLTVTEWEEWGNPVADPEVYAYMKGYSPYDNVADRRLPHDPRHRPGSTTHGSRTGSRPSGCRLRAAPPAASPIYLKTEMGAGHQGPSGRYDAWQDEAFVFAFILDALGCLEGS